MAIIADAPQVVAPQIDQHDVLGAFLGIVEQLLFQLHIFLLVGAAPPRARERAIVGDALFQPHQHLRRCANQRQIIAEFQQEHIWGGISRAQGAVYLQRAGLGAPAEALRQHDLKGIAITDILLGRTYAILVHLLFNVRDRIKLLAVDEGAVGLARQRRCQGINDGVYTGNSLIIRRIRIAIGVMRVRQHNQLMLGVIER